MCNQKYIEKTIDLLQAGVINQHILRRLLNKLLSESNKMPEQVNRIEVFLYFCVF